MISTSVAIGAIILIMIGGLIQPSLLLLVAIYVGYDVWENTQGMSPQKTVEQLLEAIQAEDKATVRALASESLEDGIDILFSSSSGNRAVEINTFLDDLIVRDCLVQNDTLATCTICMSSTDIDNCNGLTLIRENRQWVVSFDK